MFTQPKEPNSENKPAYKTIAPFVTEQIIPYQLVSKNTEMMKTKEKHMLDQNLLENHLYNFFGRLQMIEQNAMIHDTEVEVHHELILTTNTIIHKTDTVLQIDLVMTKVLLLHTTLDLDITTIKETRGFIALLIEPHTDHLVHVTLVTDIDHAQTQEI